MFIVIDICTKIGIYVVALAVHLKSGRGSSWIFIGTNVQIRRTMMFYYSSQVPAAGIAAVARRSGWRFLADTAGLRNEDTAVAQAKNDTHKGTTSGKPARPPFYRLSQPHNRSLV
jgi:hypothetical protein